MRKLSRVSNGSPSPAAYAMRDDNGRGVRPDSFPAGIRPGQGDHPMTEFPTASPTQPLTDGHLTAEQPPAEQPAAPVIPATGDDHAIAPYTPYTPYAPTEAPAPFSDLQIHHYAALPPSPPFGDGVPPYAPPRPPRRGRFAILAIVALLLTLGIGVLAGVGIGASHAGAGASSGITIGARSAPNVSVSSSTTTLQQSVESVSAAVEPSVVKITSVGGRSEAIGSGDILTADGYIVTNDQDRKSTRSSHPS